MSSVPLTLLCFSYAGGDASFYSRWGQLLPHIQVIPVNTPGRGQMQNAAPLLTRQQLIDYLFEHYGHHCMDRFALFGHSLGGRIAFEFEQELERTHGLKATSLFVSGCLAPERFTQAMRIRERDLSDVTLLQVLAELGGTPPELIANPSIMKEKLPMIRADFMLAIDLSKSPVTPVDAPINLLLGSQDKVTSAYADYPGWMRYSSVSCHISVIEGDHFFIRSQAISVANLVGSKLQEIAEHER